MEAVSDGGLSEELEDVSEDEEVRVFQNISFFELPQARRTYKLCADKIMFLGKSSRGFHIYVSYQV